LYTINYNRKEHNATEPDKDRDTDRERAAFGHIYKNTWRSVCQLVKTWFPVRQIYKTNVKFYASMAWEMAFQTGREGGRDIVYVGSVLTS